MKATPSPSGNSDAQQNRDPSRRLALISWACALSPFFLLFAVATVALHDRIGLGHWPEPMIEDCETPAFRINGLFFAAEMFFAWLGAGPLWLVCMCFRRLRPLWPRTVIHQIGTCMLGWFIIGAVPYLDPTTFSAWFLD